MTRILTIIALLFAMPTWAKAHSTVSPSPEIFIQNYFNVFNEQDEQGLDTIFTNPFLRITGGLTKAYSDWRNYINFEAIKATGWQRSVIENIEAVYSADDTAVLKTFFSRLDKDSKIIASAEVLFIVAKQKGDWKLASIVVPPSLPVSKGD